MSTNTGCRYHLSNALPACVHKDLQHVSFVHCHAIEIWRAERTNRLLIPLMRRTSPLSAQELRVTGEAPLRDSTPPNLPTSPTTTHEARMCYNTGHHQVHANLRSLMPTAPKPSKPSRTAPGTGTTEVWKVSEAVVD